MDVTNLLIQLASGAAGGTVAGILLRSLSLGLLGNSLAGIVGGGLGGQILGGLLGAAPVVAGALDIGAILAQAAGGGIGGTVVMVVVGLLKKLLAR